MTGKGYYFATFGTWRRHAARFANSHFIALNASAGSAPDNRGERQGTAHIQPGAINDDTPILVLIEADEGAHLTLEDDPGITPLPQPLAQKSIPEAVQTALAAHGVPPQATTFEAAEALAKIHPLLRHRVF
jgi:hypothetical protein